MLRAASVAEATARAVVAAVGEAAARAARKPPGIAEAVEWAKAATLLDKGGARWPEAFRRSIGVALKDEEDLPSSRPGSTRSSRRRPHERRAANCRAPPAPSSRSSRCCAPTVLPSRPSRRGFLAAIELLGPRSLETSAGRRWRRWRRRPSGAPSSTGCSTSISAAAKRSSGAEGEDEETVRMKDEGRGRTSRCSPTRPTNPALPRPRRSAVERRFARRPTGDALRRLSARGAGALPRRRGHRRRRARRGPLADLRRTLREPCATTASAAAGASEAPHAAAQNAAADRRLRLDEGAHRRQSAARACARAGGRQCRGLHVRHAADAGDARAAAQAPRAGAGRRRASGQRLGRRHADRRALQAFLAVPRFGGYARGAAVVILSDGLERGDHAALRDAVASCRAAPGVSLADAAGVDPGFGRGPRR